jgi:hypothetical protein
MKRSSKVLKSFIVPGLLVFSLVASVSAQGLDIRRYQRVPPTPIMPPTRPMLPTPIMPPTPIQDPSCVTPPSGLVGWWKGDGNTLDSVLGNNGVAQNITYTNGVVGQAFACDPNNFPYGTYTGIQIPDQPAYVLTNSLSIEGWVRPRGDGYCIFWRGDNRPGMDPYFIGMWGNNNIKFQICDQDGNTVTVGTYLTYNQWTHVAATLDGSTGTMSIYTNGVLADQTVTAVRPFGDLIPEDSPGVGIGNLNDGENNFPFTGDIDEISLYNRALTTAEIQSIYNASSAGKCPPSCTPAPSGLVGWWPGEGNANDIVGMNNGLLENVTFTSGVVGQAFACDPNNFPYGTYTGIQIPDQPAYVLTNSLSIEGWIRPRGDGYCIFWRGDNRPGLDPYVLSMQGNNNLRFYIEDESGNSAFVGTNINYNQWYHVAATWDGESGIMKLYINGQLASQTVTAVRPFGDLIPGDSPGVGIGNLNDGQNNFPFTGDIDEISLYNRALSAAEIQAIYNAGSAGKCAGPLPPGITVQPSNQTTVEGSNIVLSVVAGGTGPFSYQWNFNGTNILGATNATLTLTNLHPNQSGNYAVTITTPYGSITSSNASVTVIAQNILVYKYAGIQKIITSGLALSYAYAGQMFFIPDNTNGVFVGWATIKGKKQYWVNPLPEYLWITISGVSNQSFTVLGQAGQGIDTNGYPNIWADLHKGQNTVLTIGKKKYFSFPNTFASDATHVYLDSQTGNLVLSESSSIYTFVPQSTQTANNTGQTLADLVNSLTKSLASQGYQTQ